MLNIQIVTCVSNHALATNWPPSILRHRAGDRKVSVTGWALTGPAWLTLHGITIVAICTQITMGSSCVLQFTDDKVSNEMKTKMINKLIQNINDINLFTVCTETSFGVTSIRSAIAFTRY